MRPNPKPIADALSSGLIGVGEAQPVTRITVDLNWYLNPTSGLLGARAVDKLPVRWWQSKDNASNFAASEMEIPNLKTVIIDRSMQNQAGTIQVVMYNTVAPPDGEGGDSPQAFGRPGYFSYARGQAGETSVRWGQAPNSWKDVLRENALLRVYQGYGGQSLSLAEAIANGNLMLTGVFLVDSVQIVSGGGTGGEGGLLTLNGRDMSKLLIDQPAWPPVVPAAFYTSAGIQYVYGASGVLDGVAGARNEITPFHQRSYAACSAQDSANPAQNDAPIWGKQPSNILSESPASHYVSEGFATESGNPWVELKVGIDQGAVSACKIAVPPGYNGCTVYISIYGGTGLVFRDGSEWATYPGYKPGQGPTINGVPYVMKFGVDGQPRWINLPSGYNCEYIRFTFEGLTLREDGQYHAAAWGAGVGALTSFEGNTSGQVLSDKGGNYYDYCLDEETEALTRRGWTRWDEIAAGDEVLGVDPESGEGRWHKVESVYRRFRENREMVRFKGASLDAFTTPEHRWLTRYGTSGRTHWTTSDAITTGDRIPLSVPPSHLPTEKTYDDAFVELVAWFWTEGSWREFGAQLSQSERKNPENVVLISRVLTELYGEPGPVPRGPSSVNQAGPYWSTYVRSGSGVRLFDLSKKVADELHQVCGPEKEVALEFLFALTADQLELFVSRSLLADGSCNKDRRRGLARHSTLGERSEVLSQTSEARIRSWEIACVLAGQPIVTHERRYGGKTFWSTTVLKCDEVGPSRSVSKKGRAKVTRERYTGHVWCPQTELGSFVARRNGSIYLTGNCEIVYDFCLWAGFFLQQDVVREEKPPVFGVIENTGAWNTIGPIMGSAWDKQPLMDNIQQVAQIVGYIFRIGERGEVLFHPPNFWAPGNYDENNNYLGRTFPVLDEMTNLVSYTQTTSDTGLVSDIIVAPEDPYLYGGHPNNFKTNVGVTRFKPPNIASLRGIQKPAMLGVPLNVPVDIEDQNALAELIAVQCYLTNRQGQATAAFDPSITPDTQIKIYDRVTGEANLHYVTSVHTEHDIDTGLHLATYSTYWLGDVDNFVINNLNNSFLAGSSLTDSVYNDKGVLVSETLVSFLARSGSERVKQLVGKYSSVLTSNAGNPANKFAPQLNRNAWGDTELTPITANLQNPQGDPVGYLDARTADNQLGVVSQA